MNRFLRCAAILVLGGVCPAIATEPECPVEIPGAEIEVTLTSYYGHQGVDGAYNHSVSQMVAGPGTVTATSEGHPIGHIWETDGVILEECGVTPSLLFTDGFETGGLTNWQ